MKLMLHFYFITLRLLRKQFKKLILMFQYISYFSLIILEMLDWTRAKTQLEEIQNPDKTMIFDKTIRGAIHASKGVKYVASAGRRKSVYIEAKKLSTWCVTNFTICRKNSDNTVSLQDILKTKGKIKLGYALEAHLQNTHLAKRVTLSFTFFP